MGEVSKSISEEEVEHVAWLARIKILKEEKKFFTRQFNTIIDYFRVMDEADTKGVQPTFHILDLANVTRRDLVEVSMKTGEALANAPKKEKGFFKAPKLV